MKEEIKTVEKLTNKLLSLMGISAKAEVEEDTENEAVLVDIQTEDEAGLLIGNRGETIRSLQAILGMMYKQKTGEWQRIVVNVADWREKQENRLRDLAMQAADTARNTGEPQPLYNLNPSQRRTVHMILAEEDGVITQSYGEGEDRYLVVEIKEE